MGRKSITMKKKERPDEVQSKTYKTRVSCGSMFVTVGCGDDGTPIEIFVQGSKLGTCRPNLEGLSRVLTLCFKYNIPMEEIIDQISKINCHNCRVLIKAEPDKEKKKKMNWSCPDAVSRILGRFNDVKKKETKSEEEKDKP